MMSFSILFRVLTLLLLTSAFLCCYCLVEGDYPDLKFTWSAEDSDGKVDKGSTVNVTWTGLVKDGRFGMGNDSWTMVLDPVMAKKSWATWDFPDTALDQLTYHFMLYEYEYASGKSIPVKKANSTSFLLVDSSSAEALTSALTSTPQSTTTRMPSSSVAAATTSSESSFISSIPVPTTTDTAPTSTDDPGPFPATTTNGGSSGSRLSIGVKVGIGIGAAMVGAGILGAILVFVYRRWKGKMPDFKDDGSGTNKKQVPAQPANTGMVHSEPWDYRTATMEERNPGPQELA